MQVFENTIDLDALFDMLNLEDGSGITVAGEKDTVTPYHQADQLGLGWESVVGVGDPLLGIEIPPDPS